MDFLVRISASSAARERKVLSALFEEPKREVARVESLMLWYMPMRRSRRQLVWQSGWERGTSERRPMMRCPVLFQDGYGFVEVGMSSSGG